MITTLTGTNNFLLRSELKRLADTFVAEYTDMGLEQLDGEEAGFDRLREALESLPFLASRKLVVLRTPSVNKQFAAHAESLLGSLSETTDVILVEPKLDKRLTYYKYLKAHTDFKEFNELDEHGLAQWLVEQAKNEGGSLSPADARHLVERVGVDQQLLSQEIAKLLSYNPGITRQTIDLLTDKTPQSSVFDLIDAAFAGNAKRALELYDEQRRMKVEPQQILAMVIWQLHVLAVVKTAGQRDANEIARTAKLSPYVVRKTQNITKKLSLNDLKALVRRVLELDVALKSQSIDADDAIQDLLLSLSH